MPGSLVCEPCFQNRMDRIKNKVIDVEGRDYDEKILYEELIGEGFKVKENGQLLSPSGRKRTISKATKKGSHFAVYTDEEKQEVRADRFAAYTFYGQGALKHGVNITFKDNNPRNISKDNLKITS